MELALHHSQATVNRPIHVVHVHVPREAATGPSQCKSSKDLMLETRSTESDVAYTSIGLIIVCLSQ